MHDLQMVTLLRYMTFSEILHPFRGISAKGTEPKFPCCLTTDKELFNQFQPTKNFPSLPRVDNLAKQEFCFLFQIFGLNAAKKRRQIAA